MSLNSLNKDFVQSNPQLAAAIRELQGLRVTRVAGAASNTKINVAAMRLEDTIAYAEYVPTTFANPTVLSDCTIQDTHAFGTVTFDTAVEGNTFAVDGTTYTVTATPTHDTDVLLGGTDAQMAAKAVIAVNNKQKQRNTGGLQSNFNKKNQRVVASANGAVVTFTAVVDGVGNAPVITGGTNITAANSATASATLTVGGGVANGNTCVVHGVTFTFRTTPDLSVLTDVQVTASDATASGAALAGAIQNYNDVHGFAHGVTATAASGVVTLVPQFPPTGNICPLAGTVTTLAASGATLAGGTATGGFKTATNTASGTVFMVWFDKNA